MKKYLFILACFLVIAVFSACKEQHLPEPSDEFLHTPFVHPGMFQSKEDLSFMKNKIIRGEEPWVSAYNRLKIETDIDFTPTAFSYISVGPYGANNIGGEEFFASGKAAYHHALMWYITNEKKYAAKAIEILNTWSYKLWGFDANNAKLNVGLMGHFFLNAAEILRHTDSGWAAGDVEQFERLILTIFYPTIKDFFAEANGNWDASMITTMLCIAVFTDNHEMFNQAVERYYRGEGNSGITRYIYQGGQCQEATRDWDHVQLGLGELAKAAQVAHTQGLDFYSVANDRLAQGYEYLSKVLTGHEVECFGDISERDKEIKRDIYESIYKHYATIKEIHLPYTAQIINNFTREQTSLEFLIATRHTDKPIETENLRELVIEQKIKPTETGALNKMKKEIPDNVVLIYPGENIQGAIDNPINSHILLKQGIHILNEPLKIRSEMILAGEGRSSILILNENCQTPTIINASDIMENVTIRDLLIEGALRAGTGFDPNYERAQRLYSNAPSREGIILMTDSIGKIRNITLENITLQNFTKNGVLISGAASVSVKRCDFNNNGASVVPGPYFHHNMKLTRSIDCNVEKNRFVSSLWGNGLDISFCKDVRIAANELSRNNLSGICITESDHIHIDSNLLEGNDRDGIKIEYLKDGCEHITLIQNQIQYNAGHSIGIKGDHKIARNANVITANKFQ